MPVYKAENGEKLGDVVKINGQRFVLVRIIASMPGAVVFKVALDD